jgi:hypothetical protein
MAVKAIVELKAKPAQRDASHPWDRLVLDDDDQIGACGIASLAALRSDLATPRP